MLLRKHLLVGLAFGCVGAILLPALAYPLHRSNVHQVSSDNDEVYEVYSAAIKELYLPEGEKAKGQSAGGTDSRVERLVVIRDRTASTGKGDSDDPSQGRSAWRISGISVDDETVQDFERKSKDSILLEPRFKFAARQVLISDQDFFSFFSGAGDSWPGFYKRYPTSVGYVLLSRVGFNRDHNQALLSIARLCGGLCAESGWVMLVKNGGVWSIKQKSMLWVS